ncbi:MAG: hypothetical protein AAGB48_08355 [Planctomycetota bacterium]
MPQPKLYTVSQIAEEMGVTPGHVRNLAKERGVEPVVVAGVTKLFNAEGKAAIAAPSGKKLGRPLGAKNKKGKNYH